MGFSLVLESFKFVPNIILFLIPLTIDILQPDVPLLLSPDVFDKYKLLAKNVENKVFNKVLGWSMPITRKGHLYLTWEYALMLFSKLELKRFHYIFSFFTYGAL